MQALQHPFVFISIFYARERWHELLPVIRNELYEHPDISDQVSESYVFFSYHRGPNIRIALKYKDPAMKKSYEGIVKPIYAFLTENPSDPRQVQLPITSFFTDFPNSQIKYNLYNERVIMHGGLAGFQLALTKILLVFFEDHPVDDDALFTLVVYLQEALLKALCDTRKSKQELIAILIAEMKRRDIDHLPGTGELKYLEIYPDINEISGKPELDKLLDWFEKGANMLYMKSGSKIGTFFTIIQIINLQVFKNIYEIFLDSLDYLAGLSEAECSEGIFKN
jgi:hypothetical protein